MRTKAILFMAVAMTLWRKDTSALLEDAEALEECFEDEEEKADADEGAGNAVSFAVVIYGALIGSAHRVR